MFVTNWISTTKIQKISEITNFFRHYFLSRTEVWYRTANRNEGNTLQTAASQPHGGIALYKDTVFNTLSGTKKTNSSEISKRNGKSFNVDVAFCWNSSWKSDFWKGDLPFCSNCHDSFWRKSRNHTLDSIFFPKNCVRTQKGIIFALEKIE